MESSASAPPPPPITPDVALAAADYPVNLDAPRQDRYHRFLPLVKWLLAFPHYLVLIVLVIGVVLAKIAAFFAVVVTGRYPRGIFDYVVGVLRWSWRVNAYVFLLTDEYPPFSLSEESGYPAQLRFDYPEEGIDNWRPLVQWLLAIPYLLVAGVLSWLARIVALVGAFVILFTEDLPEGMFELILIPHRWALRGAAYSMFMVDRYPPFEWE